MTATDDSRYAPEGELEGRAAKEEYERAYREAWRALIDQNSKQLQAFLDKLAALTHEYGYVITNDGAIETLEREPIVRDRIKVVLGERLAYDSGHRYYYVRRPWGAQEPMEEPYECLCCSGVHDD